MAVCCLAADFWISIHAPREGGDTFTKTVALEDIEFQSTPPARGATKDMLEQFRQITISIHAPREGGDC